MKKSVVSIIFNFDRSSVLLIKRRDVPVWVLPGGGIDEGESPEDAAIRESLEETGLHVAITRKVAEYSPLNRLSLFTYLYECHELGGSLSTGDETQKVDFFPLDKLPETLFFLHREWLDDALRNHPEVIEAPIHQVTYINLLKYLLRHPKNTLRFALSRLGFPLNSQLDD